MNAVKSINTLSVIICLLLLALIANPVSAFSKLSKESIKIYPDQAQICTEMAAFARDIQQYRKAHPDSELSDYESTVSPDDVALKMKFVMAFKIYHSGEFARAATPDEVASRWNSHCVGTFQLLNDNSVSS